jgi:cytidylate kinase
MTVITISREFGSEGEPIAKNIAQALGYHLVDKEFIIKVLDQYGLVEYDREYETKLGFWEKYSRQRDVMVNMLNQVVGAVAKHGNVVILGRSGYAILAGFTDVLHVRLQAPLTVRVARVMAQQQIPVEQAEAVVKENDAVRLAFVEEFYRVPWGAVQSFDLVINTGKISPGLASNWVIDATKAFTTTAELDQPTTAAIVVDSVLAKTISAGLECNQTHHL